MRGALSLLLFLLPVTAWGQGYTQPSVEPSFGYRPVPPPPLAPTALPSPILQPASPPPPMPVAQTPAPDVVKAPEVTSEAASKDMIVDLAIIDKNLGRRRRLEVPMGRTIQYRTMEVLPQRCVIDGAAKPVPQHALLAEIYVSKPRAAVERVFSGWMFAGDPSLSGLSHPYYDVVVFGCHPKPEEKAAVEEKATPDAKKRPK